MVRTALAGESIQTEFGRKWVWQIRSLIKGHQDEVDILFYDTPQFISQLLGHRRCICIPTWIQGDLDFSLIDFTSSSLKDDIRKIRNKNEYTFEVTKDKARLEFFYNQMYVPYVIERYGGEAIVIDF